MTKLKNVHKLCQEFFILLPTKRKAFFYPSIIAAFSHHEYFAHHLNGKSGAVIANKLIDFQSLLENMMTAMFKMSLSSLALRISFFSRAFSFFSSVIFGFPCQEYCYSLCHRYNNSGRIQNSSAISWCCFLKIKVQLLFA
jgi:hypothetical protein